MFAFGWPWMFFLLFVPLAVRFLLPARVRSSLLPALRFPHLDILRGVFESYTPQGSRAKWIFPLLLWLIWACLVGALMRPQLVDQMTQVENKGYDIMLDVDLSGSMRALDFSTNTQRIDRLDVAKKVVGDFVKDRPGDRIGLVLFGDYAYQYAPLTYDTKSVGLMLDETVISMAGDGTAIGDAIGLSVKALRDRPEKSRVIILLTDGEDTASSIPPLQAAQLAKDYGIRIYTIGIGSKGRVPYPDQFGRVVMVEMNLDEGLLRKIATMTGGSYFHAADAQALQNVYSQIDQMEKTTAEKREYMIRTPLYRYPLGAAMGLLLLLGFLPLLEGRRRYAA
ncbi:MAG: VWA domain-containing protein [Alphaproteobacteria bacterium]|nr:VWA domain-containing protein [Alphaproteobacteria bacterium]